MAIIIDTSEWATLNKVAPSGEGFYEVEAEGKTVGSGRPETLSYLYSSDGVWSEVKDRALTVFREAFGVTAEIRARLIPRRKS